MMTNERLQNCLVEDRATLVTATSFLFDLPHRKASKMQTTQIISKLESAHLSCEEILDDLIEDDFNPIELPDDYGELLMIWYGAALRFSSQVVKTANKQPRKNSSSKIPADGIITLLVGENPKKVGSKAHSRFELYKNDMTVGAFLEAGGRRDDIRWDINHNFIRIN